MDNASVGGMLRQLRQWLAPRTDHASNDGQLLQKFLEHRDEAAFARLVERHGPMVLAVCRDMLNHEQDVEDAFQATFLVLALRGSAVRRQASVGSWLHGVAYRVALKARSRRSALRRREQPLDLEPLAPDMAETRCAQQSLVHDELQRLPEKYSAPLLLCCWEGKTQEEAAAQLGWTKGMVKGRLERGKDRLRFRLAQRGVTLALPLAGMGLAAEAVAATVPAALLRSTIGLVTLSTTQIPEAMQTLMEGAVPPMPLTYVKLALVLSLALIGVGLGWAGRPQPTIAPAQDKPPKETNAGVGEENAKDQQGDALPRGALQRIGTVRFRHEGLVQQVAYLPDGKGILSLSSRERAVQLWDATSGLEQRRFSPRQGSPICFAVTMDGTTIAIGGRRHVSSGGEEAPRGFISLYDVATGKLQREWLVNKGQVSELAFAPAGDALSATTPKMIEFYDPKIGARFKVQVPIELADHRRNPFDEFRQRQPRSSLPEFSRPNGSCAFSPNGKLAVVCLGSGTVSMIAWEGEKTTTVTQLRQKSGYDFAPLVRFSPDGQSFVTVGERPGQLSIWETATGQRLHEYGRYQEPVGSQTDVFWEVAFAPDGRTLYLVGDNGVQTRDLLTGMEVGRWSGPVPARLTLSPDGRTAAGAYLNCILLRDATTGQLTRSDQEHRGAVNHVAFSPDGKLLATASQDRTVWLREAATGRPVFHLQDAGVPLYHLAFSADGRMLAATGYSQEVWLWDTATGRLLHHLKYQDPLIAQRSGRQGRMDRAFVRFTPDGSECVRVSHAPMGFVSWKTANGQVAFPSQTPRSGLPAYGQEGPMMQSLAVTADFRQMAWSQGSDIRLFPHGFAQIIGQRTNNRDRTVQTPSFMPQEPINPGQSEPITVAGYKYGVNLLAYSRDGKVLAVAAYSYEPVQLLDAATGKLLRSLETKAVAMSLAFSADGRHLAMTTNLQSGSAIQVFDTTTGKLCLRYSLPTPATTIAFSPDRRRLATGHADSTTLLWEVPEVLSPVVSEVPPPAPTGMELLWEELGERANTAQAAVVKLVERPGPTVAFLATRLKPSKALTDQQVQLVVADLQRDGEPLEKALATAQEALANNDVAAIEQLQKLAVPGKSVAVEELLNTLAKPSAIVTSPPVLQRLRAIQVLERIGTPEARKLLESLAQGMPTGRDTRAAQEALARLNRPPAP